MLDVIDHVKEENKILQKQLNEASRKIYFYIRKIESFEDGYLEVRRSN